MNNNINKKRDRDIFENNTDNSNSKNNSNNSNEINNDSTVKLNPLLFNDVLPYMLYSCKFQRLLDLSLISKSVFKLVQFNVTFKQNQIKFYPYDYQLLEYVKRASDSQDIRRSGDDNKNEIQSDGSNGENGDGSNDENGDGSNGENDCVCEEYSETERDVGNDENHWGSTNDEEYQDQDENQNESDKKEDQCKLKLIQFNKISILYLRKSYKSRKDSYGYDLKDYLKELKMDLIKYCNSGIKKVYFVNYVNISYPYTADSNISCRDLFQFKKVFSYWDRESPPISTKKDAEHSEYLDLNFKASFRYLRRIKPKKFKFSTNVDDMDLQIPFLNNILKCTSLESIKFGYHDTLEVDFIAEALSSNSPQLKELTIRPFSGKSIGDIFAQTDITNNKSLRKLILRQQVDGSYDTCDPSFVLQQLIGNTSIQELGLELYYLEEKDYKLLSPLIQIPNIQEIRCNLDSAIPFILHCNENPNIKILQIKNDQTNCNYGRYDNQDKDNYEMLLTKIIELFSKFITKNQSLETIKITACYGLYDSLVKILNNNNNNNNDIKNLQIIKMVDRYKK